MELVMEKKVLIWELDHGYDIGLLEFLIIWISNYYLLIFILY